MKPGIPSLLRSASSALACAIGRLGSEQSGCAAKNSLSLAISHLHSAGEVLDLWENDNGFPRPMSISELNVIAEKQIRSIDEVFSISDGVMTINVIYPYEIELARIRGLPGLLKWASHLSEKPWMTCELLNEFIKRVIKAKGWKPLHG